MCTLADLALAPFRLGDSHGYHGGAAPALALVLIAGVPVVLDGPDPDLDDVYRLERADYDDRDGGEPSDLQAGRRTRLQRGGGPDTHPRMHGGQAPWRT